MKKDEVVGSMGQVGWSVTKEIWLATIYCRVTVQNLAIIFWMENVWITLSPYKLGHCCHITNKM